MQHVNLTLYTACDLDLYAFTPRLLHTKNVKERETKVTLTQFTLNLFSAHVCVKSMTSSNGLL